MKHFLIKAWIATPVCKSYEYIEYTCDEPAGCVAFLKWKKDRLIRTHGEKNVIVTLIDLWEAKHVQGRMSI